jgi:hypothetical protein
VSLRTRYLLTTLALLALGVGVGLSQWRDRPSVLPRPPARDVRVPAHPAQPPTAGEVLSRAEVLQLRPEQAARLRALERAWRADVASLEAALGAASADFERFVADARRGGGASVLEFQRRSADLQALSAELRERRAAHSRHAVETLTNAQRDGLRRKTVNAMGGRA